MSQTPAGWYPQPDGTRRYWDGAGWTDHVAPAQFTVAPKNPAVSLIASFFIPGLGTIMNGEGSKGAAILVGYIVAAVATIVLIGLPFMVGFWIWGMVDAYSGAQRWNAQRGIIS